MKKLLLVSLFTFTFSLLTSFCRAQAFAKVTFDSLSSGMTSHGAYVLSLAMKDSSQASPLFAGGHFTIAGRDTAINIAEWVDSITFYPTKGKWKALGKGVNSDVCALQMCNNYLYAGGKFDSAGGIAASHIARWNTTALKWDSLLGKLNGNVYALCVYNRNLYVGGDFTIADGDTVNRIAVWKDSVWAPVGKGFDTGAVYALTVSNDTLFAGGSFLKSNGVVVNHIAKLKGNSWDSLGSGTNNTVYALADGEYFGELFVGGAFTKSGGIAANYISFFDDYSSYTWGSLAPGVNDTVRALNAGEGIIITAPKKQIGQGIGGGDILLIGGNFDSAGGYRCHYIAGFEFDFLWDTIGELNGPVFALANPYNSDREGDNFVGGKFDFAKNFTSSDTVNNVAYLYIIVGGGGIQSLSDKSNIDVYPNPSNGKFNLICHSEQSEESLLKIKIYNILGEEVLTETLHSVQGDNTVDISNNPSGIYLYRVLSDNGNLIGQGKLIIQK